MRLTKAQILKESGIRDINKLSQQYKKAEIYFHQDLDGVITAIGMRHYLASKGIRVVDAHIIQYGDKEFSVKRPTTDPEIMPVLVDFAHGKPEFKIWTDHHDSQAGDKTMGSGNFRQARSNAETISQIVSPQEIFPTSDILIVNTVDSADYARHQINPEEVINSIFQYDKEKDVARNKMMMGLVANKLLLSFKNKPGFLEELVMTTTPSLHNLFHNVVAIAKREGYATPERIAQTNLNYYKKRKESGAVKLEDGIIISYGGGMMWEKNPETGKADPNYDRYTVFRIHPDAEFNVVAWPMGLLQASCNPFKEDRALKGVNLGAIAQEVLSKYENHMKKNTVSLAKIKRISEKSVVADSVGFRFSDLLSIYKDKLIGLDEVPLRLWKDAVRIASNRPYKSLPPTLKNILSKIRISVWDVIQANSGGHKCITNISGLNYLKDPVASTKLLQQDFVKLLKEKIAQST
jgi:hypothetical protein